MEPKDFFRVLLRRKRTVVTALVVVIGVALFGSMQKAATYAASCKVRIAAVGPGGASQIGDDPKKNPTEIYASFEEMSEIIQSPTMAAKVSKDVGAAFERVTGRINAAHTANTGIFNLTIVDGNPAFAAKLCDAYMVRFLKERVDGATAKVQASKDLLDAQIADIQGKIKDYDRQRLAAAAARISFKDLDFEQLGLFYEKSKKIQDKVDLDTALKVQLKGGGEVISNAGPGTKVGPDHMRDGILGVIVGMIFGAGLALVREYMDDTVRDKEAAQRDIGVPVLASLPSGRGDDPFGEDGGGSIEAARTLRTNLASQGLGADIRCIVVTSTLAKRTPTVLVSLAGAIAEAGRTVLVIGADFRNPRIHEAFGVGNAIGLTNVIRGQVTFDKAIRPVPGNAGVYVMPSGPVMGNPGELLSTEEMAMVVRRARKWADIVLIDAPPVLAAADASVLGTYSDGVLLVMSAGQTLRSQANEAKEQLKAAGAKLLGAVMFGASDSGSKTLAISGRRDDDMMPPLAPYGGGFDDAYGATSYGGGDFGGSAGYGQGFAGQQYQEPYYDTTSASGYEDEYEDDGFEYEDEPVVARARTSNGKGKAKPGAKSGTSQSSKKKQKAKTLAASAPARVRREDATMTRAPRRPSDGTPGAHRRPGRPASKSGAIRPAKPSALSQNEGKTVAKRRSPADGGRAQQQRPARAPSRAPAKPAGRPAERTNRSRPAAPARNSSPAPRKSAPRNAPPVRRPSRLDRDLF